MARHIAKTVVANQIRGAKECTVHIAYGIGQIQPEMVTAQTQTGEDVSMVKEKFPDLSPGFITEHLQLTSPNGWSFFEFASYGLLWPQPVLVGPLPTSETLAPFLPRARQITSESVTTVATGHINPLELRRDHRRSLKVDPTIEYPRLDGHLPTEVKENHLVRPASTHPVG